MKDNSYLLEERLIRLCSGSQLDEAQKSLIRELSLRPLDWLYIYEKSYAEGVSSFLYRNLTASGAIENLPGKLRAQFRNYYYLVYLKNKRLLNAYFEIQDALEKEGLSVMALKGVALLGQVYQDLGVRPMEDIDILVEEEDLPGVTKVLEAKGYRFFSHYKEDFRRERILVDVHTDLVNANRVNIRSKLYRIDLPELWDRSLKVELLGKEYRVLCPEDQIIHLSLHLSIHHGFEGLIRYLDINEMLRKFKNVHWDSFLERCAACEVCKPVYYTFLSIQKHLESEVPEGVLRKLARENQGKIEKYLFTDPLKKGTEFTRRFLFTFFMLKGLSKKIRFLKEVLLPQPSTLRALYILDENRFILKYYLLHLKDALSLGGRMLARMVFHL